MQKDVINGRLSMGHARVVAGLKTRQAQKALRDIILKKDLSVRQAEAIARREKTFRRSNTKRAELDYYMQSLAENLVGDMRRDRGKPLYESLSDREYQVMCMFALGKTAMEIARTLDLSVKTISTHRTRILKKLNMDNNAQIIRYAIKSGLVE